MHLLTLGLSRPWSSSIFEGLKIQSEPYQILKTSKAMYMYINVAPLLYLKFIEIDSQFILLTDDGIQDIDVCMIALLVKYYLLHMHQGSVSFS